MTHVLAISPLLSIKHQIPSHSTLEELLLRTLSVGIKGLVRVTLKIGSDLDDGLDVVAAADEHTRDDGVVGFAQDTDGAEEVLAGCL